MIPLIEVPASPDRRHSLPYLPGLDGLRAIAVAAVVAYHLGMSWAPGGFLGVDLFFVISGFLITSLLVRQLQSWGRLNLGDFYWRRAKRLLPALVATLVAVGAWTAIVASDVVDNFRREVLAALFYGSNWYLIGGDSSYFEAFGRPSPLRHLWSLAIEEQFYLFWPVALAVGLAVTYWRPRLLPVAITAVAVASFVWMAVIYEPNTDPTRVYFGTDTRLGGLLLGSVLALVWRPWERPLTTGRRWLPVVIGAVGVIGFVVVMGTVGDSEPGLYRLGFLWISLLGVMAVAGAAEHGTPLTAALSLAPLVWLGYRSYAMYLVHWPIIVFTRPGVDVTLTGWPHLVLQVGLILAATEALHRLVEVPIRRSSVVPSDLVRVRWWTKGDVVAAGVVVALVIVAVGLRPAAPANSAIGPQPAVVVDVAAAAEMAEDATQSALTEQPRPPTGSLPIVPLPAELDGGSAGSTTDAPTTAAPATAVPTTAAPATAVPTTAPATAAPTTALTAKPPAPAPTTVAPGTVAPATVAPTTAAPTTAAPAPTTTAPATGVPPTLVIGDSVAVGAGPSIVASFGPQVAVDAVISRQFSDLPAIVQAHATAGTLPQAVVIHLGTNGNITADHANQAMDILTQAGVQRIVLVNARVPRPWEGSVNATLAQIASERPNTRLADWYGQSAGHADWFAADGVHLTQAGIVGYVSLIGSHLTA